MKALSVGLAGAAEVERHAAQVVCLDGMNVSMTRA
jgi:hypothetical protein